MHRLNKKAAEKLLSIWWFFVLLIVGGSIFVGVLMFYSADVDVRPLEAKILTERIYDCLLQKDLLYDIDKKLENFDIYAECQLNKKIFNPGTKFYFKVSLYDENSNLIKEIAGGDNSFETDCKIIDSGVRAKKYPRCFYVKKELYSYNDGSYVTRKLEITGGSNQYETGKISVV
jgi:hypothetical protein